METRCRVTPGGGNPRESATESKPPEGSVACGGCRVRVKGWGKSPPHRWQQGWHGKPHREQDRIGTPCFAQAEPACFRVGVSGLVAPRRAAMPAPDEWSSIAFCLQNAGTEPGLQASWSLSCSHDVWRSERQTTPRGCSSLWERTADKFGFQGMATKTLLQSPFVNQPLTLSIHVRLT